MSERLQFLMGVVAGMAGLIMLAQLDVPVIRHGGVTAAFAAFELLAAVTILSAAVALGSKQ